MKTTLLLAAALSLAAAGAARADDITPDDTATVVFTMPKTRTQVRAELMQARADGSARVWANDYNPLLLAHSERSRADVRAEARDAAPLARAMYGEDSGSVELAKAAAPKLAAPLMAALSLVAR